MEVADGSAAAVSSAVLFPSGVGPVRRSGAALEAVIVLVENVAYPDGDFVGLRPAIASLVRLMVWLWWL
jgi:hypothetical protein